MEQQPSVIDPSTIDDVLSYSIVRDAVGTYESLERVRAARYAIDCSIDRTTSRQRSLAHACLDAAIVDAVYTALSADIAVQGLHVDVTPVGDIAVSWCGYTDPALGPIGFPIAFECVVYADGDIDVYADTTDVDDDVVVFDDAAGGVVDGISDDIAFPVYVGHSQWEHFTQHGQAASTQLYEVIADMRAQVEAQVRACMEQLLEP